MSRPVIPCDKCASTDTDLYRDRNFSGQGFPHDAVLHCRCCGHRLYGGVAMRYAERLLGEAKKERRRRVLEKARIKAEQAAEQAALREQQRVEILRQRGSLCAWGGCRVESRPTSKYCSRTCSNKNAHSRHKRRLQGPPLG